MVSEGAGAGVAEVVRACETAICCGEADNAAAASRVRGIKISCSIAILDLVLSSWFSVLSETLLLKLGTRNWQLATEN
jgi:hypothetical protein